MKRRPRDVEWPYNDYTNLYNRVTEPSSFLTSSYVVTFKESSRFDLSQFIFPSLPQSTTR